MDIRVTKIINFTTDNGVRVSIYQGNTTEVCLEQGDHCIAFPDVARFKAFLNDALRVLENRDRAEETLK